MPTGNKKNYDRVIVYCIGNPYRSDDGVGPMISQNLRAKKIPGITIIDIDDDGLALLQKWSNSDKVIIVDASFSNQSAGTIFRFDLIRENVQLDSFHFSTHNLNISDTILLAKELHRLPAELRLFAIEGKSFNMGTAITQEVIEASNIVSEAIFKLCESWLQED